MGCIEKPSQDTDHRFDCNGCNGHHGRRYWGSFQRGNSWCDLIAGVILSAVFFVAKISKLKISSTKKDTKRIYTISGQVFFASVEELVDSIDMETPEKDIVIDFSQAHVWDDSGVAAIDKIVLKLEESGKNVQLTGMNKPSSNLVKRLAIHSKVDV